MMLDFHIIITTHNRQKSCLDLIKSIQKQLSGKKYSIHVFDDHSDSQIVLPKDKRIKYFRFDRYLGASEYWWMVDFAFKQIDTAKHYVMLPDGVILDKHFFKNALSQWKSIVTPHKLLMRLMNDDTSDYRLCFMSEKKIFDKFSSMTPQIVNEIRYSGGAMEYNIFQAGIKLLSYTNSSASVDVIMLSYTKSRDIYDMTKNAIASLRSSQPDMDFNIVLVETNKNFLKEYPFGYDATKTIIPKIDFNYNKFLNIALKYCKNDYVVMVNNDVLFEPRWMSRIIDAMYEYNIDSASPFWKEWFANKNITVPSGEIWVGNKVGEQVFGYCIVTKKSVLKKIGKFDEQFEFWFQDNDYAMQLAKHGFKHALIKNSIVRHFGATSHNLIDSGKSHHFKEGMKAVYDRKYTAKVVLVKNIKASAIIVNWNEAHVSVESANRLLAEGIEVIVVDNGSDDNSDNLFNKFGSRIRYIRLNNNYGSSIARNVAVCYASHDRTFLIDGDILYVPNTIAKYSAVMDMLPDAGIVGYYDYDRSVKNAGAWSGTLVRAEADSQIGIITKINCWYPMAWTQYGLFKTSVLKEIQFPTTAPFNQFGWGYEDDWFFYAMRAHGYKSYSVNAPNYYHDKNFGRRELKKRGLKDMFQERRKAFCERWGLSIENYEHTIAWIEKKYLNINI